MAYVVQLKRTLVAVTKRVQAV